MRFVLRPASKILLIFLGLVVLGGAVAQAQDPIVPDRRLAITRDLDFFGSDLKPVFQTTFEACQQICLNDKACNALTFNTKSSACFPKSAISEKRPFDGALSATVFRADPKILKAQKKRVATLDFLPKVYLDEAREQARTLAGDYVTNEWTAEQLLTASRTAENSGNRMNALRFMGAALNLTDAAGDWEKMSNLALFAKPKDSGERRKLRRIATSAAINAYLRASSKAARVSALNILAMGMEKRGNGKSAIFALRQAQSVAPRLDTQTALARLVSLYGFRVSGHNVDNNAASPRMCVTFSEDLVQAGVDYGDYLKVPRADMPVEANGRQLCVGGLRHGERYQIALRAGLPAASGEKLSKGVDLAIYVRDRDPSARFVGKSYVLPRGKSASIPIVTVNLSEVDLKIHRVGDRNLVRAIQLGYFQRPLSAWDENDIAASIGEEVWSGKGVVSRELNRDVTTALPVGEAVSRFKPGVYVMRARVSGENKYDTNAAAQWFVVTDLALATMTGGDGLHVFVRSLNEGNATRGVSVRLLAKNNDILAEATTDSRGYVRFAPGLIRGTGGGAPALVTAQMGDDFAFLSLKGAGFDLSDRGVAGRVSPPPIDVFLTTDRGAYRAGETVNVTALVRDTHAEALENLPLTVIVKRPDGVEFTRALVKDTGAGGHVYTIHLPRTAQRGTWKIAVHTDTDAPQLAAQKFLVEDLIPERIDFDLALGDGVLRAGDVPVLTLDARYLYGAPASGLAIEAETRVTRAAGLSGYKGYRFGRQGERFGMRVEFTRGKIVTDDKGRARFALAMPDVSNVSVPLQLETLVRLREGSGRPVERRIEKPIAPKGVMIGIKPLFDGIVPEGGVAGFQLVAVGPDLAARDLPRVGWVLNRVCTRYQWYQSYGNWKYEAVTTRTRIANGEVALSASAPVAVEAPVDWGRYELKVETLSGDYVASSRQFRAGWYAPADTTKTPDTLDVSLDREQYRIGDTAHLRLVPRYAGTALITVVSNHLIDMKTVAVTKGENLVDLPVTEGWGAGAYVTATVIRPMDVAAGHNPARALGLNWASVDPERHLLSARFVNEPEAGPRATMSATLQVDGVTPGETVYATIAAVDVGILNLTRFTSPDPAEHYFGQRRLGMVMRDVYGNLIDGNQGAPGKLRSGGDSPQSDGVQGPPPTEDLVAFFSGPLSVGADGRVSADFDIPAFNGTVRLMAVVWSKTGVGQAAQDVLIRDPIVLSASLPRFMAPYDQSRVLLELAHATGPTGNVALSVSATGGLFVDDSALPATVRLGDKQRVTLSLPITAPASGTPEIIVTLTTPGGKVLRKNLILPVRVNDPEVSRTSAVALADGDALTLSRDVFDGLIPGTGHATLAVGPSARFDAPGLLSALDRYPYGCTEQITSRAMPLLYFNEMAESIGLSGHLTAARRINETIAEVLSNQASNGGFGLWRPGSGDLWLDAYVSDFLSRARAKGFAVPAQAFQLAIDNLSNRINYAADFEKGGEDVAYALMVLAREGVANIGDLRYYADARADNFATSLALAQLGAALASYGDQKRADAMFSKAGERLSHATEQAKRHLWRADYGTALRDTAAVLTLAVESGSEALDLQVLAREVTSLQMSQPWRSTQENMWALMAANALREDMPSGSFLVNGRAANGPVVEVLDAETGADRSVEIRNVSGKSAHTLLTTYGVPSEPEPAGGNGYFIDRFYYTLDGKEVSPEHLTLNERLVVVLKITPQQYGEGRLIVNDPLPAGLEIDNPHLLRSGDVKALDWLKLNATSKHSEFRADRFVAAVDWSSKDIFQLAYMVRAISPGVFHHPAASVEDMYRPEFRARTKAGRVEISSK